MSQPRMATASVFILSFLNNIHTPTETVVTNATQKIKEYAYSTLVNRSDKYFGHFGGGLCIFCWA